MDVTLLPADDRYEVGAFFAGPGRTMEDNRLSPGLEVPMPAGEIQQDIRSHERLLAIAGKAGRQPIEFHGVAQPGLDTARGCRPRAGDAAGQVLEGLCFEADAPRWHKRRELDESLVRLCRYRT